jgi:hypothetical protein
MPSKRFSALVQYKLYYQYDGGGCGYHSIFNSLYHVKMLNATSPYQYSRAARSLLCGMRYYQFHNKTKGALITKMKADGKPDYEIERINDNGSIDKEELHWIITTSQKATNIYKKYNCKAFVIDFAGGIFIHKAPS